MPSIRLDNVERLNGKNLNERDKWMFLLSIVLQELLLERDPTPVTAEGQQEVRDSQGDSRDGQVDPRYNKSDSRESQVDSMDSQRDSGDSQTGSKRADVLMARSAFRGLSGSSRHDLEFGGLSERDWNGQIVQQKETCGTVVVWDRGLGSRNWRPGGSSTHTERTTDGRVTPHWVQRNHGESRAAPPGGHWTCREEPMERTSEEPSSSDPDSARRLGETSWMGPSASELRIIHVRFNGSKTVRYI